MNKSDIIRQIAAENPQLSGKPTAIAKLCLQQKNITVTAAAVNQALKSKKAVSTAATSVAKPNSAAKASAVVKTAKAASPAKATSRAKAAVKCEQGSNNCAVDTINAAKSLLQMAGSVDHAKQVLDALTA